jgi:hypothetical protein
MFGVKWHFLKPIMEFLMQLRHERLQCVDSSMYTCLMLRDTDCFSDLKTREKFSFRFMDSNCPDLSATAA